MEKKIEELEKVLAKLNTDFEALKNQTNSLIDNQKAEIEKIKKKASTMAALFGKTIDWSK